MDCKFLEVTLLFFIILIKLFFHAKYLSSGSWINRRLVLINHPNIIIISGGVPSASNFDSDIICLLERVLLFPLCGQLSK